MNNISLNNLITTVFILLFSISCSQSNEPIDRGDEDIRYALSQTGADISANGKNIVFEGLYDGIYAVHFVDINGNYKGYILNNTGFLSSPTWAPDMNKIAVSIEGNIYTLLVNGDSLNRLTNTGEDFHCNWSPDGKYIAYTKSICDPLCGIAVLDLADNSKEVVGQYGGYASWNSDSDEIYYYHTLYDGSKYQGIVFKRINVETQQEDSLYFVNEKSLWLDDCTVSLDEKEILFGASYDSPPQMNIWKIDLQTKEMIQMTFEGGTCPVYTPDNQKIIYTNTNLDEGGLWIMDRDGANKKILTKLQE